MGRKRTIGETPADTELLYHAWRCRAISRHSLVMLVRSPSLQARYNRIRILIERGYLRVAARGHRKAIRPIQVTSTTCRRLYREGLVPSPKVPRVNPWQLPERLQAAHWYAMLVSAGFDAAAIQFREEFRRLLGLPTSAPGLLAVTHRGTVRVLMPPSHVASAASYERLIERYGRRAEFVIVYDQSSRRQASAARLRGVVPDALVEASRLVEWLLVRVNPQALLGELRDMVAVRYGVPVTLGNAGAQNVDAILNIRGKLVGVAVYRRDDSLLGYLRTFRSDPGPGRLRAVFVIACSEFDAGDLAVRVGYRPDVFVVVRGSDRLWQPEPNGAILREVPWPELAR
jgi:hypothetical protein